VSLTKILLPFFAGTLLFASSGASIYKKSCKSCHGAKGDKLAMSKSKVIHGMTIDTLDQAMKDYVSGKRKSMSIVKKVKKAFIDKYSQEEVQETYKYINEL